MPTTIEIKATSVVMTDEVAKQIAEFKEATADPRPVEEIAAANAIVVCLTPEQTAKVADYKGSIEATIRRLIEDPKNGTANLKSIAALLTELSAPK